jgi:hypothetical protein
MYYPSVKDDCAAKPFFPQRQMIASRKRDQSALSCQTKEPTGKLAGVIVQGTGVE